MKVHGGIGAISIAALIGTSGMAIQSIPAAAAAGPVAGAFAAEDNCSKLRGLHIKDTTITVAESLTAGAAIKNSGLSPMFGDAPDVGKAPVGFCRIVGHIRPTSTSDIGFEVWMPSSGWDGRLHGIGIGGFAGAIDYYTLGLAVKAGQATVATDTGHRGGMLDGSWSKGYPEKVTDYNWRAIHLSTVAAKQLVSAFYGKAPDKSYFVGCSGGGRQALVEAARFPGDYDGIVSGAPASSFSELTMAFINAHQAQNLTDAAIRPAQAKFIEAEVLRQCDRIDGQADGLVADPRQCRFDAAKLTCKDSSSPLCFSDAQIGALRRLHDGPRTSAGFKLAGGYLPSGSEAGDPAPALGWDGYVLVDSKTGAGGDILAKGMLDGLIPKPFATLDSFNFDRDPAKLRAAASEIDAPPNLSRFFARGGKLIIWHGWADAAIPPETSLHYYDRMVKQSGAKAQSSARLFMVPGVQHCFGGKGPDAFGQAGAPAPSETPDRNMVMAMQLWAEGKRSAPETFVARRGHGGGMMPVANTGTERQRLLCAWPKREVLTPGSDPDKAASYTCK